MRLYIMRHGEAEPFSAVGDITQANDAKRALTQVGQQQAKKIGHWFQQQLQLTDVFVSPYLRAQQTAKQVTQQLSKNATTQITTLSFITPNDNAEDFHAFLLGHMQGFTAEQAENYQVLVVAHMPIVSYLVAEFTAQQQHPIFDTAAVACIEFEPATNTGELIEMISAN